jgi:hypothetical protein
MRLLLVTFAGTVAANLVTVMLVAIAIIFARPSNGVRPTPGTVLFYLLDVWVGTSVVVSLLTWLRKKRPRGSTSRTIATITVAFVTVTVTLSTVVVLLILLGWAVGVK